MKIFNGIKNDLRHLGCLLYDHPHKELLNFIQCCLSICISFIYFTTPLWFILFEAEKFTDYMEAFVPALTGAIAFFTLCSYLWQRKELLQLIMNLESIIKNRKQHSIFIFNVFFSKEFLFQFLIRQPTFTVSKSE